MKVYMCGTVNLNSEELQYSVQLMSDVRNKLREQDADLCKRFYINYMKKFRTIDGVPNKILTIAKRNSDDKWCLLVFDHEPTDKVFDVKVDEDGRFYIEV